MMHHTQLAEGKRSTLSFLQQMGNIGSEVYRAQQSQHNNTQRHKNAKERMLELIDLTLQDTKGTLPQKIEVARMREVLCDFFYGENIYHTDANFLNKYFLSFGILANQKTKR